MHLALHQQRHVPDPKAIYTRTQTDPKTSCDDDDDDDDDDEEEEDGDDGQ